MGETSMSENNEFKPYIPAEKIVPAMTVLSIVMGALLAVVFGAANAYLGLRVGMTVSASIPAAASAMMASILSGAADRELHPASGEV